MYISTIYCYIIATIMCISTISTIYCYSCLLHREDHVLTASRRSCASPPSTATAAYCIATIMCISTISSIYCSCCLLHRDDHLSCDDLCLPVFVLHVPKTKFWLLLALLWLNGINKICFSSTAILSWVVGGFKNLTTFSDYLVKFSEWNQLLNSWCNICGVWAFCPCQLESNSPFFVVGNLPSFLRGTRLDSSLVEEICLASSFVFYGDNDRVLLLLCTPTNRAFI